jgi:hypothetical protein
MALRQIGRVQWLRTSTWATGQMSMSVTKFGSRMAGGAIAIGEDRSDGFGLVAATSSRLD